MYRYGRSYGSTFKQAFKRDELAYELRDEDEAQGTYNPYARNTKKSVPLDYKTFDGWKALGKWVKKGSKASKFNGMSYFHISQVR